VITFSTSRRLADAMVARGMLDGLENYYPDFGHWYVNTCIPGIVLGSDTMLVARDGAKIVGIALGKKTPEETKLRCVRVLPQYQSKGVGLHLIEKMLRELDADKPHCTVAEEMMHQFSRAFVNYFDFKLSRVDKGVYRPGKLEYIFNGART
jgi:GNAT superfamily N-acetyltransferase